MGNSMAGPLKTKLLLPYGTAACILSIHLEKTITGKDMSHAPSVHCTLFTTAMTWKQARRPSAEERVKMRCPHTMEH